MQHYVLLIIGAVFVNNFVLSRFLGCCPFLGVSKRISTAMGMSSAVIFVMTAASMVTWAVDHAVLCPLGLEALRTLAFILVIAAFVQLIDIVMKKKAPRLHGALGIYLPLITTNCAVLGVASLNATEGRGFFESALFSFSAGVGFALALLLFAGLREKIDRSAPPRAFRGVAIALVTAGLLALSFMGFNGLVR